jgi:gliding motility-associated-like protein
MEAVVDYSSCGNSGFAVTINAISSNPDSELDFSNIVYQIIIGGKLLATTPKGNHVTELAANTNEYNVISYGLKCNGSPILVTGKFSMGLEITKAEYRQCTSSDIFVSVAVTNGKGPYKYELFSGSTLIETSDGSNEISFSTAKPNASDLKIKVTDVGCEHNISVTKDLDKLSDFGEITSIIEGNKAACQSNVIELSVKNGYSGSDYLWKKGSQTLSSTNKLKLENVTSDDAGEYSFSMILDGCESSYSETFNIEIGNPPTPNVSSPILLTCLNSGEISLGDYVSVTSDKYTLVWYKSGVQINTPQFNPNLTGTTEYSISQKSGDGCEGAKATLSVVVKELPVKTGENNIIFCISKIDLKPQIRIINAGSNTYNLYTAYSGGDKIGYGMAVNDTAIIETTQDLVDSNDYFLETQNEHGCVASERTTVHLSLNGSLILAPEKICFGDNLTLSTGYSGGKVIWTKPDNSTFEGKTLIINNAEFTDAGTYSLFIEESVLGCVMNDEKKIAVTRPAVPKVDKISYRFYENESAMPLTATAKTGLTLKWYNPEGMFIQGQESPVPNTQKIGTFVYQVSQDSLGCESPKVQVTVIVGEIPQGVPVSDISTCIADKPIVKIKNTVPGYKYTVYYKNNAIAQETGNGVEISLTSNVTITENTEIGITVTDEFNVNSEQTKINLISSNNLVDSQNSSLSICFGSDGKLVAVDITDAEYKWTTPGNITVNESFVSVTDASNDDDGEYTLVVTVPGCSAVQQSVELKIEKPAKPSTTKEIHYCKGDNAVKLTATPLSGYQLVWFDETQTQLPDAPTPNSSVIGTSKYYVAQESIFDANCSSDQEEITVIVEDKPDEIVLEPVNLCYTTGDIQPLSIRIPVSSEGYTYSIYSQQTEGSRVGYAISAGDDSPVDIAVDDEITSNKTYYLEVVNTVGCASNRTPVEIILLKITLSPDELPIYQVDELYLQRFETNISNPEYMIVEGYLPIGLTISSIGEISGIVSEYSEPLAFTVEVTDDSGCSIQKEYVLKGNLRVSKMFSPNGDGINDVFMRGYKVIIFDRLGRKLFTGDDGWDGSFNGKIVPEDTYYYILYFKDKDGNENRVINNVTLIKTF